MNKIINKNKILHTLGFFIVVVFSTSSGKTEAGEDAAFKHQVYDNIARSLLIKDENFPKGQYNIKNKEQSKVVEFINFTPTNQYTIKNKGQCKDGKKESFECAVLNLDKTIENRKKNNGTNILWDENGCNYSFYNLPNKALKKVEITSIIHYEDTNYIGVNQGRYYKNIDREFSLELMLKVTGEGDNKAYYPEYAKRIGGITNSCKAVIVNN